MNIVMIAPFAYAVKGTVRARIEPIAKELANRNKDVHIVIPPWDNPEEGCQTYEQSGVTFHHLDSPGDSILGHCLLTWRTVRRVQSLSPDLVHAFKPVGESAIAAAYFALGTDIPVVLDTDDWEGKGAQNERRDRPPVLNRIIHYQESFTPQLVDAVTVASRTLETQIWGHGVSPKRTFYAPNGQAADRIRMTEADSENVRQTLGIGEAPTVLLYTRFFEYDLHQVIDLFEHIINERPETEFIVVGEGKYGEHENFAEQIKSRCLEDSIHMVGWVDFEELPDYFAATDLAVYPFADTLINRSKCPAKVTELMAAGVPIVADDVGEISEYIENGSTGILVPPDDQQAFTDSVMELLEDDSQRTAIGKEARERILTEFSWASITDTIERSYEAATE